MLLGDDTLFAVAGSVIATLLFGISAYSKNYNLGEIAERHRQAANELWVVREQYVSLLTDLRCSAISVSDARIERDRLVQELSEIFRGSPNTNAKAYRAAQKALQNEEELTFSDEEIDKFLPAALRKSAGTNDRLPDQS